MATATTTREQRIAAGLADELVLPPVRESLADLAAGLRRLGAVDCSVLADPDVVDLLSVAARLCNAADTDTDTPLVVELPDWDGPAVTGGLLGDAPVTPAAAAFAARCDAGWLSGYCHSRPRAWQDLGQLVGAVEHRIADLADMWRSADDDRIEAQADIDLDAVADTSTGGRTSWRLHKLADWNLDPGRLAARGGFTATRPGTQITLIRLARRLRCAAQLIAQVGSIRATVLRALAYGEVDQLTLDEDLRDLWLDMRDDPPPDVAVTAEARVVGALRDAAVLALADAARVMAIPVLD